MKAISIRAPWWWFILHGGKRIENRDWPTRFRGPVWIHASTWWRERDVWGDCLDARDMVGGTDGFAFPSIDSFRGDIRRLGGHIVGHAHIVDCVEQHDSPWFVGKYGFVLDKVEPVPIPWLCTGALGLFDTPWALP